MWVVMLFVMWIWMFCENIVNEVCVEIGGFSCNLCSYGLEFLYFSVWNFDFFWMFVRWVMYFLLVVGLRVVVRGEGCGGVVNVVDCGVVVSREWVWESVWWIFVWVMWLIDGWRWFCSEFGSCWEELCVILWFWVVWIDCEFGW